VRSGDHCRDRSRLAISLVPGLRKVAVNLQSERVADDIGQPGAAGVSGIHAQQSEFDVTDITIDE
jgi:hypothetical protein